MLEIIKQNIKNNIDVENISGYLRKKGCSEIYYSFHASDKIFKKDICIKPGKIFQELFQRIMD